MVLVPAAMLLSQELCLTLLARRGYFSRLVDVVWGSGALFFFVISVISLLINFFKFKAHVLMLVGLLPLAVALAVVLTGRKAEWYLCLAPEKLATDQLALQQIHATRAAIETSLEKKRVDLALNGRIQQHRNMCSKPDCFCKEGSFGTQGKGEAVAPAANNIKGTGHAGEAGRFLQESGVPERVRQGVVRGGRREVH